MNLSSLIQQVDESYIINESIQEDIQHCELIKDCGFILINTNIRSLRKNFNEFIITLNASELQPACIVLTETHCNDGSPHYNIPGYMCFGTTNKVNKNGGVLVFVHEMYNDIRTREVFSINHTNCLELLIDVKGQLKYQILGIYRTHESNIDDFIDQLHDTLITTSSYTHSIIAGDFNINISQNYSSSNKDKYINMMTGLNYKSCISSYTREVFNQQPSCLDHIWSNIRDVDNIIAILWKTCITDHFTSIYGYKSKKNQNTYVNKACKRSVINYDALERQLQSETWSTLYSLEDCNMAAECFENTVREHIKRATYLKDYTFKNRNVKLKPWMTHGILTSKQSGFPTTMAFYHSSKDIEII
jgi:hypothetical protein